MINNESDNPFNLDEEELEIEKMFLEGKLKPLPNSKELIKEAEQIAKNTLRKKSITIRLSSLDIDRLKYKAETEGLPYQTLISSILHKYVTGQRLN